MDAADTLPEPLQTDAVVTEITTRDIDMDVLVKDATVPSLSTDESKEKIFEDSIGIVMEPVSGVTVDTIGVSRVGTDNVSAVSAVGEVGDASSDLREDVSSGMESHTSTSGNASQPAAAACTASAGEATPTEAKASRPSASVTRPVTSRRNPKKSLDELHKRLLQKLNPTQDAVGGGVGGTDGPSTMGGSLPDFLSRSSAAEIKNFPASADENIAITSVDSCESVKGKNLVENVNVPVPLESMDVHEEPSEVVIDEIVVSESTEQRSEEISESSSIMSAGNSPVCEAENSDERTDVSRKINIFAVENSCSVVGSSNTSKSSNMLEVLPAGCETLASCAEATDGANASGKLPALLVEKSDVIAVKASTSARAQSIYSCVVSGCTVPAFEHEGAFVAHLRAAHAPHVSSIPCPFCFDTFSLPPASIASKRTGEDDAALKEKAVEQGQAEDILAVKESEGSTEEFTSHLREHVRTVVRCAFCAETGECGD